MSGSDVFSVSSNGVFCLLLCPVIFFSIARHDTPGESLLEPLPLACELQRCFSGFFPPRLCGTGRLEGAGAGVSLPSGQLGSDSSPAGWALVN